MQQLCTKMDLNDHAMKNSTFAHLIRNIWHKVLKMRALSHWQESPAEHTAMSCKQLAIWHATSAVPLIDACNSLNFCSRQSIVVGIKCHCQIE